jgi:hypothetical protein
MAKRSREEDDMQSDLFEAVTALGIEYSSWQSDLYLPATQAVIALVKHHGHHFTTFHNNIDGSLWIDVPFAYSPFWISHNASPTI